MVVGVVVVGKRRGRWARAVVGRRGGDRQQRRRWMAALPCCRHRGGWRRAVDVTCSEETVRPSSPPFTPSPSLPPGWIGGPPDEAAPRGRLANSAAPSFFSAARWGGVVRAPAPRRGTVGGRSRCLWEGGCWVFSLSPELLTRWVSSRPPLFRARTGGRMADGGEQEQAQPNDPPSHGAEGQ